MNQCQKFLLACLSPTSCSAYRGWENILRTCANILRVRMDTTTDTIAIHEHCTRIRSPGRLSILKQGYRIAGIRRSPEALEAGRGCLELELRILPVAGGAVRLPEQHSCAGGLVW